MPRPLTRESGRSTERPSPTACSSTPSSRRPGFAHQRLGDLQAPPLAHGHLDQAVEETALGIDLQLRLLELEMQGVRILELDRQRVLLADVLAHHAVLAGGLPAFGALEEIGAGNRLIVDRSLEAACSGNGEAALLAADLVLSAIGRADPRAAQFLGGKAAQ